MADLSFEVPAAIVERIGGLRQMPIAELRVLWHETFHRPPLIANRRFLERRIAYHWQAVEFEKVYPGVLASQRARIAELAAALDAAKHPKSASLSPGTVLIRAFNGTDHEVRVAGVGVFEYAGKRYESLSAVARKITGTRWSGPTFFGLNARKAKKK